MLITASMPGAPPGLRYARADPPSPHSAGPELSTVPGASRPQSLCFWFRQWPQGSIEGREQERGIGEGGPGVLF